MGNRMARKALAAVLIFCTLLGGCVTNPHMHGGQFVAEYKPDECPPQTRTPYAATYVLYQWLDPPPGAPPHTWVPEREVAEMYIRGLGRHESIGFDKDANGGLVAVAGNEKIPLPEGRYCWHISVETEYRGGARVMHEVCENTWDAVCFPFEVACGAIMLPLFVGMMSFCGLYAFTH
jgi:hypothetical protein